MIPALPALGKRAWTVGPSEEEDMPEPPEKPNVNENPTSGSAGVWREPRFSPGCAPSPRSRLAAGRATSYTHEGGKVKYGRH